MVDDMDGVVDVVDVDVDVDVDPLRRRAEAELDVVWAKRADVIMSNTTCRPPRNE